jgi:DNA-directed RNA polymerase alpha subunit
MDSHLANPQFRAFFEAAETVKPVKLPAIPGGPAVPITIAKLGSGQALQVLCKAEKNYGREHAKWSPCCCAAYRMEPVVTINRDFFRAQTPEWKESFVRKCPSHVFRYDQADDTVEIENQQDCTFCRQCVESLEEEKHQDQVQIGEVPDKYIFSVEGTGALKPQTIVSRAFEILKRKLEGFLRKIEALPVE